MPCAPVDDNGTQLYYEDTGAPPDFLDYKTLVLVHGGVFNGSTFKPMFAHATDHNMRLIAVNTRDYRGSTPFSISELEALRSTDMVKQRAMIHARGLEIAAFLLWLIRKENIPRRRCSEQDGRSHGGGVALLGWSWGNTMTMSFLAQAGGLLELDRCLLNEYLTALIVYDSARHGLGVPPEIMEGFRGPARGSGDTMEQNNAFQHWLSGYYAHSPSLLNSFSSTTLDELRAGLSHAPILDSSSIHQPSTTRMTPQEFAAVTDPAVVTRAHPLFHAIDPVIYKNNVQAALWDSTTWPHLKVTLIWCDMSPPETILSAWYLARQIKEVWPRDARRVDVLRFEGVNHFPHWDQPAETIEFLARVL